MDTFPPSFHAKFRHWQLLGLFWAGIVVLLLPVSSAATNKAGTIWYFGEEVGLDFSSDPPAVLTDAPMVAVGGCAAISNAAGQLLFYSDGVDIWTAQHAPMENGQGLPGSPLALQPVLIVPRPGHPSLYYLITISEKVGVYFSLVDMNRDEGLGAVIEKNVRLWNQAGGQITAVHHQNGVDIWVIVTGATDNTFHAYLVTADGIQTEPVVSHAGIVHIRSDVDRSGILKAAPDGSRLALSVSVPGFFELFAFDNATGEVSQNLYLGAYEAAYGVEFSPDSSKLYATTVNWTRKDIYQFDLNAANIPQSVQVIGETSAETRFHALQVGLDGRIYVARQGTSYLGVINNPNLLGTASRYVDEGIELESRICRSGLPNFVQSFFTPPIIKLIVNDVSVKEDDGQATFTVSLSEASRSEITVHYATEDHSATKDQDYVSSSGRLFFQPGEVQRTFAVPLQDDEVFDEGREMFIVRLSQPQHAVLVDAEGRGTILDNDLVEMSVTDAAAREHEGALSFTVTLSGASRSDTAVSYATSDGSARQSQEYVESVGILVIPSGETSGTIEVPLLDDTQDEEDKTLTLALRDPVNATLVKAQAVGTIGDDDPPPEMSLDNATIVEDTATLTFTTTLSSVSQRDVLVEYTTVDDTAQAGSDYTATAGTLLIPAGMQAGTILVDIVDDEIDEDNETFTVQLSAPVNATLPPSAARGTIQDNDALPQLSIADLSVSEDAGAMRFLVTLSAASGRDVSVSYATRDKQAVAEQDYEPVSGLLTIPAGSLTGTIALNIRDDANREPDEPFALHLSNAANAALTISQALVTIQDNDPLPAISISDARAREDEASLTFQVALSHATYQDVRVNYHSRDGSASFADGDYRLLPDSVLNFPAGATSASVSVSIQEDTLIEGDETLFVVLRDPVNATLAQAEGRGTIINNDALPTVSVDDVTAAENAGSLTFTVSLSEKSQLPVIFSYTTHAGTAQPGRDYVEVSGTMAIAPDSLAGVIEIPLLDDALPEEDEIFSLELSDVHNAACPDSLGTGAITDDDAPSKN